MEAEVLKFLDYLRVVKNASEHTIRNYGLDLGAFQAFAKGVAPAQVDKKVVRGYLADLNLKQIAKRTILRRLSSLRSFFKYLVKEKRVPHNPLDEIQGPKLDKKIPASLTYAQVQHLFEQPDVADYLGFRDRCIMEL